MTNPLLDDGAATPPPPTARRRRGRQIALVAGCAIIGLMFLVVLLQIGGEETPANDPAAIDLDVIDLVTPEGLNDDDRAGRGMNMDGQDIGLVYGGWIQATDKDDPTRVTQQYRCTRLDPDPPGFTEGWVRMENPQAELFLDNGRILTLEGDSALVHTPEGEMESGTLSGDVLIKLFEPVDGRPVDTSADRPTLIMATPEASFDNYLGEVSCPLGIRVSAPSAEFLGGDMRLLVNDQTQRISMVINEVDSIRFVDAERVAAAPAPVANEPAAAANADGDPGRVADGPTTPTPAAPSPPAADFYRLVMTEDVMIEQGDLTTGRRVIGDRLDLIFSFESDTLGEATALGPARPDRRSARRGKGADVSHLRADHTRSDVWTDGRRGVRPLTTTIVSLAIGASAAQAVPTTSLTPAPSATDTYVRCSGPLVLTPLAPDDPDRPARPDDSYLTITGNPVRASDLGDDVHAVGERLFYDTRTRRAELHGSETGLMQLVASDLHAAAPMLWITPDDGRAGLAGTGWMKVSSATSPPPPSRDALMQQWRTAVATAEAVREGRDQPAPAPDPVPASPQRTLHITWTEGVNLTFAESGGDESSRRIREAVFNGDVDVEGRDFALDAARMTVGFDEAGSSESDIRSILAEGAVRAENLGEAGVIACRTLTLDLTPVNGEPAPDRMLAVGDVMAADASQTIWTNRLEVTFDPAAPREMTDRDLAGAPDRSLRNVDAKTVRADGGVQVLLPDGERIFADELDGDVPAGRVELRGENVLIVRDDVVIDRGREILVIDPGDQGEPTAEWKGPGTFTLFNQAVQPASRERLDPDEIRRRVGASRSTARIDWSEQMRYDGRGENGAATVEFRGAVDGQADPSALEHHEVRARTLTLGLSPSVRGPEAAPPNTPADTPETAGEKDPLKGRSIRTMIAKGDATVESRTWEQEDRSDAPRIFAVSGQHIEHDQVTEQSRVVGDGKLVIQDLRGVDPGEAQPAATGLSGKGLSRFTWSQDLHIDPIGDERFRMEMNGDVQLLHQAADGRAAALTGETLRCRYRRIDGGADREEDTLGLSGAAEIERITGAGGVIVRTPERDIDCDEFIYDADTQLAQIIGRPDRPAVIMTRGGIEPVRVVRAVWNLRNDVVTVESGVGGAGG